MKPGDWCSVLLVILIGTVLVLIMAVGVDIGARLAG